MHPLVDLTKYIEAGFDTLWQVNNPSGITWFAGFFCQGPESMTGDGLICYLNLSGSSETVRDLALSPEGNTIQEAIDKAYELWKKDKDKIHA